MFDFQKLTVYEKARAFNKDVSVLLKSGRFDKTVNDQLKRAALSIMLNIAESSSRFSNKDRRNLLVIARGSAFECVAVFDHLSDIELMALTDHDKYSGQLEEISRMLYSLIKKLE